MFKIYHALIIKEVSGNGNSSTSSINVTIIPFDTQTEADDAHAQLSEAQFFPYGVTAKTIKLYR